MDAVGTPFNCEEVARWEKRVNRPREISHCLSVVIIFKDGHLKRLRAISEVSVSRRNSRKVIGIHSPSWRNSDCCLTMKSKNPELKREGKEMGERHFIVKGSMMYGEGATPTPFEASIVESEDGQGVLTLSGRIEEDESGDFMVRTIATHSTVTTRASSKMGLAVAYCALGMRYPGGFSLRVVNAQDANGGGQLLKEIRDIISRRRLCLVALEEQVGG